MFILEAPLAAAADENWVTTTTAWLALALAVVGLFLQILTRYWDGGRIRVRLQSVLLPTFEGGGIMTSDSGEWPLKTTHMANLNASFRDPLTTYLEVAEIVIENRGRTAATIFEVGFEWRDPPNRLFGRRSLHHIVPRSFEREGFAPNMYVKNASGIRLEPYDQVTILMDYWSILEPGRVSPRGSRRMWAAARVAGSGKRTRSSRRKSWVIPDDAVTALSSTTRIPVRTVVNRAIFGAQASDGLTLVDPGMLARQLSTELSKRPYPADAVEQYEIVKQSMDDSKYPFDLDDTQPMARFRVEYVVQWTLDRYRNVIDWPEVGP